MAALGRDRALARRALRVLRPTAVCRRARDASRGRQAPGRGRAAPVRHRRGRLPASRAAGRAPACSSRVPRPRCWSTRCSGSRRRDPARGGALVVDLCTGSGCCRACDRAGAPGRARARDRDRAERRRGWRRDNAERLGLADRVDRRRRRPVRAASRRVPRRASTSWWPTRPTSRRPTSPDAARGGGGFEPRSRSTAGRTGWTSYRRILAEAREWLDARRTARRRDSTTEG